MSESETPQQDAAAELSDNVLVQDKKTIKRAAVKDIEKEGKQKKVPPKENQRPFIKVDKQGDIISNFFSNFLSQFKNPTNFSLFKAYKQPNKNNMATTTSTTTETSGYRYKVEEIDWKELNKYGLTKEKLEELKVLDHLLKGYKTDKLVPISNSNGATKARLLLKINDSGKVDLKVFGYSENVNLNFEFSGHKFTKEDKENLLKTGNMGRIVDLDDRREAGKKTPSVVSIDRLTNQVVSVPAEWIKVPQEIKGVKLTPEQQQSLSEGKPIYLQNWTTNEGKLRSTYLQYNADKTYLEFLFANDVKEYLHKKYPIEAPKAFRGKELTDKQYEKLQEGKPVQVKGLVDKNLKMYEGFITYNKETGKTQFSYDNPNSPNDAVKNGAMKNSNDAKKSEQKQSDGKSQEKKPGKPAKSKGRKM
jgi:hypothetical protein